MICKKFSKLLFVGLVMAQVFEKHRILRIRDMKLLKKTFVK